MSKHVAILFVLLAALLLAGCSTLVSVEPVPFQYERLNLQQTPDKPAETPPAPDSPLAAPMPAADMAPAATFGFAELEAAATAAGIVLLPGSYSCDFAGDDYARCMIHNDGVPGGQLCVWAGGWGACE